MENHTAKNLEITHEATEDVQDTTQNPVLEAYERYERMLELSERAARQADMALISLRDVAGATFRNPKTGKLQQIRDPKNRRPFMCELKQTPKQARAKARARKLRDAGRHEEAEAALASLHPSLKPKGPSTAEQESMAAQLEQQLAEASTFIAQAQKDDEDVQETETSSATSLDTPEAEGNVITMI